MAWASQDVVSANEYTLATLTGGVWLDPFGTLDIPQMLARLTQYASGWAPLRIEWKHGLFGIGESLQIYGRGLVPTPADAIRNQIIEALNSFWVIAAADVSILVSDSISTVLPAGGDSWSSTLQIAALAVIAVAVVWGISQIREVLE